MSDNYGILDKDGAAEPICEECESPVLWVECEACGGEGVYGHDCGEDCCACLYPEENEPCSMCGSAGGWYVCPNCITYGITEGHWI